MKTIHKLARPQLPEPPKLKVAAYARASTSSNEQLASLQTQITHYENHIQNNDQWEYVGVYYDEGTSGTKVEKRDGLHRLIKDAELRKIDLILTKSISRFSRNTVDCLNLVRKLTDIGVTIFFEKENINTGDMESELLLSILSSLAESESYSHSENMKWANRKRMAKGIFKTVPPYGYQRKGADFYLIPDEAKVIEQIFKWALEGVSAYQVAKRLNEKNIFTRKGSKWQDSGINNILHNIVYTGTMIHQRYFNDDQFRKKKNNGELPMYRIDNNHPPIISWEDYERVQELITLRANAKGTSKGSQKYSQRYVFTKRIICDKCGCNYKRVHIAGKGNTKVVKWSCTGHLKNKDGCDALPITDESLKTAYLTMLNKLILGHTIVLEPLINTPVEGKASKQELEKLSIEITKIDEKLEVLASLNASGVVSTKTALEEQGRLQMELNKLQEKQHKIMESVNGTSTQRIQLEQLHQFTKRSEMLTEWDEDLFLRFAELIVVYSRQEVSFELKCGLLLKERLEA